MVHIPTYMFGTYVNIDIHPTFDISLDFLKHFVRKLGVVSYACFLNTGFVVGCIFYRILLLTGNMGRKSKNKQGKIGRAIPSKMRQNRVQHHSPDRAVDHGEPGGSEKGMGMFSPDGKESDNVSGEEGDFPQLPPDMDPGDVAEGAALYPSNTESSDSQDTLERLRGIISKEEGPILLSSDGNNCASIRYKKNNETSEDSCQYKCYPHKMMNGDMFMNKAPPVKYGTEYSMDGGMESGAFCEGYDETDAGAVPDLAGAYARCKFPGTNNLMNGSSRLESFDVQPEFDMTPSEDLVENANKFSNGDSSMLNMRKRAGPDIHSSFGGAHCLSEMNENEPSGSGVSNKIDTPPTSVGDEITEHRFTENADSSDFVDMFLEASQSGGPYDKITPHEMVETDEALSISISNSARDEVDSAQERQKEEISSREAANIDTGTNSRDDSGETRINRIPENSFNDNEREADSNASSLTENIFFNSQTPYSSSLSIPASDDGTRGDNANVSSPSQRTRGDNANVISPSQRTRGDNANVNSPSQRTLTLGNSGSIGNPNQGGLETITDSTPGPSNSGLERRPPLNRRTQNSSELVVNASCYPEFMYKPRTGPFYPEYSTKQGRFKTFGGIIWPWVKPGIAEIVSCGFFYKGPGDRTQCFMCGIILYLWEPSDFPLEEHRRHSPACLYLETINLPNIKVLSDDLAKSVQAILRLGHDSEIVERAVQILEAEGKPVPKAREILGEVHKISESAAVEEEWSLPPDCEGAVGFDATARGEAHINQHIPDQSPENDKIDEEADILEYENDDNNNDATITDVFETVVGQPEPKNLQEDNVEDDINSHENISEEPAGGNARSGSINDLNVEDNLNNRVEETCPESEDCEQEESEESDDCESEDEVDGMNAVPDVAHARKENLQKLRERNEELKLWLRCKVCMENESTQLYIDCGHLSVCLPCSGQLRDCPICRKKIRGSVTVFVSASY